jgi:hypothetical protein
MPECLPAASSARPQEPADHPADCDAAELAADIIRLRHRLARLDLRNHPRISAELGELGRQIPAIPGYLPDPRRLPVVPQPVQDAAGYNLKPDPLTAMNGAELVDALREYRQWTGGPSFRTMAERIHRDVAHSTMCAALKSKDLPRLKVVVGIVAGCGGSDGDQQTFATAWRRIQPLAHGSQPSRPEASCNAPNQPALGSHEGRSSA